MCFCSLVCNLDPLLKTISFGRNNYGQIGNGTNHNQMIPMKVTELESHYVTAIACGSSHSLALTSDGSVWAWGNNSQGNVL